MSLGTVLIVEDNEVLRSSLKRLLKQNQYTVSHAASVCEAKSSYNIETFDLIISDLRLPGLPGSEMITLAPNTPVIIMASDACLNSAVDTMRMGAVDYIPKPFDHTSMLDRVKSIMACRLSTVEDESGGHDHDIAFNGMLGQCDAMRLLFQRIKKAAPTDATVLIQGESGTGKELVARALHENSRRSDGPLISVNCAAIPENLIESELFGHEKGSFTGATAARTGLIEAANGGTLFLDEIGELPLEAQARLLRVLQEGEIRRIGSVKSQKVNVRLVAATHRNLRLLSSNKEFREDLYFRLKVVELWLPALRERGHDILMLAEKLLERVCQKMARDTYSLSPEAMAAICQHQWPGNVRELEHAIEQAVILSDDNIITAEALDLDVKVQASLFRPESTANSTTRQGGLSLKDYFQRFVLEHQGQMTETELARKLGISRKTLWERRQRLGIPKKKVSP